MTIRPEASTTVADASTASSGAPSEPWELHTATSEDVDSIVALGREVFQATFAHTVTKAAMAEYLDSTYTASIIKRELASAHRTTIIAVKANDEQFKQAGQIGGFMTLATNTTEPCLASYPNAMELQRIYTHPSTHGTGLAKRLAQRAEAIASERGYAFTWLGVLPENHRAVAFYRKMGYEKVGTHEFRVGAHVDVDDIMLKKL